MIFLISNAKTVAPVGYDIKTQSYRCPYCGETSGVKEVQMEARYRRLNREDRKVILSSREVTSCPNCGAELLYEEGEESETCSFCGGKLIRGEFETSEEFPEYIIPFVLTLDEAKKELETWTKETSNKMEATRIREHIEELQGYYLPYELVQGPVNGYVCRENVNREFYFRGYVEDALINTSRQLDNETLDAAEPFDLQQLKPFEHGYIGGHKVKLADLSGAKKERRLLLEAGDDLKPMLEKIFHTDGIRINMEEDDLMEIPILLPVYFLKAGRKLAVVNGQTGRVAVKTELEKTRFSKWILEPLLLSILVILSLWLAIGNPLIALISCPPLVLALFMQYAKGHFSIFGNIIEQSEQKKASRVKGELQVEKDTVLRKNPFPVVPVFQEKQGDTPIDVTYRFYPWKRVVTVTIKTLLLYFLPTVIAFLFRNIVQESTQPVNLMGSVIWFWCFGIFCMVYIFSGIRGDAYEHPYTYQIDGNKRKLVGSRASRKLPFFACVGFEKETLSKIGAEKQKVYFLALMMVGVLFLSVFLNLH